MSECYLWTVENAEERHQIGVELNEVMALAELAWAMGDTEQAEADWTKASVLAFCVGDEIGRATAMLKETQAMLVNGHELTLVKNRFTQAQRVASYGLGDDDIALIRTLTELIQQREATPLRRWLYL